MPSAVLACVLVLIGAPGALAAVPHAVGAPTERRVVPAGRAAAPAVPALRPAPAAPAGRPPVPAAPAGRPPVPAAPAGRPPVPAAPAGRTAAPAAPAARGLQPASPSTAPGATASARPTPAPTSAPGRRARPTGSPAPSAPASTPIPAPTGVPGGGPGQPAGELTLGVTNDRDNVALGEPVRYVITLRNTSATPQRFTVRVAAPAMLDDVQTGDRQAPDGVLAWPVVVPAHGQSTMEFRARVENSYDDTNMMKVTACGQPDGARQAAVCATDLDDLMVRRASTAPALPWLAAGVALVLLAGGAGWWWRRRRAA